MQSAAVVRWSRLDRRATPVDTAVAPSLAVPRQCFAHDVVRRCVWPTTPLRLCHTAESRGIDRRRRRIRCEPLNDRRHWQRVATTIHVARAVLAAALNTNFESKSNFSFFKKFEKLIHIYVSDLDISWHFVHVDATQLIHSTVGDSEKKLV